MKAQQKLAILFIDLMSDNVIYNQFQIKHVLGILFLECHNIKRLGFN